MKKTRIKIILFLAIIALFPCLMPFTGIGGILVNDNRMATSFPTTLIDEDGRFDTAAIEDFFSDNIGLRSFSYTADAAAKYTLFHFMSDSDELQGENHQTFLANKYYPQNMPPFNPLTTEELQAESQKIAYLSDYYEKQGIPFLFVTIPNKEEVYPEFWPSTFLRRPSEMILGQIAAYMEENEMANAFDMTPYFYELAHETDEPLWSENDDTLHWNAKGAFYGYKAIMERMQEQDASLFILSESDFEIASETKYHTTRDGKYTYKDLPYTKYTYTLKNPTAYFVSKEDNTDLPLTELEALGWGGDYQYWHNPARTGTLVISCDSFIYLFNLGAYFAESYEHVYVFWRGGMDVMKKVFDRIEPDAFLFEYAGNSYTNESFDDFVAFAE